MIIEDNTKAGILITGEKILKDRKQCHKIKVILSRSTFNAIDFF